MSKDDMEVDAVVALQPEKKKVKKSKDKSKGKDKDKKKEKKEASSEDAEPSPAESVPEVDAEEKKRRKKEKKARKEQEKAAAAAAGEDAMPVDAEAEPSKAEDEATPKESKKDKKRKRKAEAEAENGEAEASSKKEKKKRRKEQEAAAASTSPEASSSKAATSSGPSIVAVGPTSAKDAEAFIAKHNITIHTPKSDPTPISPVVSFSQLSSLPDRLREAFKGFKEPSPIQACAWPPALAGKDVVGIAETGSGKTLAFGIPALNFLINTPTQNSSSNVSTLVVAPTRELAIQTHDTLSALGKSFGIASVAIFGGVPKEGQIRMLRASLKKGQDGLLTRIVVGTPGRILDLMNDGALDLSNVNYLVLDEADRMLDKGFENDIRRIIEATKPMAQRQTMMFSATWPENVRRLASTFQRDPVRVTVGSDDLSANSRVEQTVEVFDDVRSKDQRLLNHLKKVLPVKKPTGGREENRVLVFALYKKETSRVENMLQRQGYAVSALHGDMSQTARIEALETFKAGTTNLLVATDVAARGLDIPNVNAVINYTFPLTIEDYIHRIGRTGRGGKTGKSITFFTGDAHERSLAGEYARVLSDGGFDNEPLKKFPMTIKKKEHSVYGAWYRDDIPVKAATKIVF